MNAFTPRTRSHGGDWMHVVQSSTTRSEEQLRIASAAFTDMPEDQFTDWRLTPAERDVALFAIKGLSTAEIAALRETSQGTVKAQTDAIYRKAGASGRAPFLSLFIEDLLANRPQQPEPLLIANNSGAGLPAPLDMPETASPASRGRG